MMTTIGNIGIGLFVLIIVWIAALVIFVVSVKYQNNNIGWITLAAAAVLTVILVSIPTESQSEQEQVAESIEKDYYLVYKKLFVTFIIISAFAGFLAVFVLHCIEPIRIKPVRSFYTN